MLYAVHLLLELSKPARGRAVERLRPDERADLEIALDTPEAPSSDARMAARRAAKAVERALLEELDFGFPTSRDRQILERFRVELREDARIVAEGRAG